MRTFFPMVLALFFTIDAIGICPTFLSLLGKGTPRKNLLIGVRELIFALIIMVLFHYVGQGILKLLSLSKTTVHVAGGIVLFLIAVRLVFPSDEKKEEKWGDEKPFIVPIATPLIAGPSVLAIIMIYGAQGVSDLMLISAIGVAWLISSLILLFAKPILKLFGAKGIEACERLMGLMVTLIAIQMFMQGIEGIRPA